MIGDSCFLLYIFFIKKKIANVLYHCLSRVLVARLDVNLDVTQHFKFNKKKYLFLFFAATGNREHIELCCAIESIFLHGLKHSLLSITMDFFGPSDVDRKPEPSFWAFIMVISHRNIIRSIQQQSQLNSDIGYCRAFIRQALTDHSLSSYLCNVMSMIVSNSSGMNSYYYKHAFLRDKEVLELVIKIMENLEERFNFDLNINSSLLNQWPELSLELAGIWSVAKKSAPVDSADDVASSLPKEIYVRNYNDLRAKYGLEILESSERGSGRSTPMSSLPDEVGEAFSFQETLTPLSSIPPKDRDDFFHFDTTQDDQKTMDSMTISIFDDKTSEVVSIQVSPVDEDGSKEGFEDQERRETNLDKFDLHELLQRYQNEGSVEKKQQPGILEVWKNFEANLNKVKEEDEGSQEGDWDKVDPNAPFKSNKKFKLIDLQPLVEQLCKISNEYGLDQQDFQCKKCSSPLSIDFDGTQ